MGNKCCVAATNNPCKNRKVANFNSPNPSSQPTALPPALKNANTRYEHQEQSFSKKSERNGQDSVISVNSKASKYNKVQIEQLDEGQNETLQLLNNDNQGTIGFLQVHDEHRRNTALHSDQTDTNQDYTTGSRMNFGPVINQKQIDTNKPASPQSKNNKNLSLQHALTEQPPSRNSTRSQKNISNGNRSRGFSSKKNSLDQEQSMQDNDEQLPSKRSIPSGEIDIPKLKVSTTIGISQEWLPPNHQKSSIFPQSDQLNEEHEEYYISDDAGIL